MFFLLLFAAASNCSPKNNNGSAWLPNYTVNDITFNFKQTKSFDKSALLEVMFLPKTKAFNQDELEKDRQRLKKFYFDNGYFDAIIDTNVIYNKTYGEVDIEILIIENTQYKIRELMIRGLSELPGNLKTLISNDKLISAGDYYVKSKISKEITRITDILQNNGYLFARVDSSSRTEVAKYSAEVQENPDFKHKVRVIITFTGVDKIYHFGVTKINISSKNYDLETNVIEREIKFREGDLFSKELMVQSERNLSKFALIQLGRIQIDTVIESTSSVNISVDISLNKKYQLTPSVAGKFIDNYFYLGAGLQFDDKNFFGAGRVLSIKFEPLYHNNDINQVSLSASLFQPYLFRDNITANLGTGLVYINFNEFLQFLVLTNSLVLNYYLPKYTFYNNLTAQLNVDLIRLKVKKTYLDATSGITTEAGTIINQMNSVLGFTATHNNTNNIFNPSSGFFHSVTLEEAGMLPYLLNRISGNILYSQYIKFYLVNYFYFDMASGTGSKVFAIGSKIGEIAEYGTNPNIVPISPQYKFFSGGGNSVRGWGAQKNGILENTANGGKFLFEGSFEYRWMMFAQNTNFLKDFGSVFFFDYGNVWERERDFKPSQISLAVGFGVRYNTFVGPIRIDVGFKLYNPSAAEGDKWIFNKPKEIFSGNKYAIQFGLGNAF